MSKEALLHKTLGGSMAASLGVRDGAVALDEPVRVVADKDKGRSRMREAGYMLLEHIIPDPAQVRTEFNQSAIERLAKSIQTHGVLMPIEIKWDLELGKHVITHGERRYRAAKLAGLDSIPCLFHDGELSESEKIQRQLQENCLREDLTPNEQARSFLALKELNGWDAVQLADVLCLSRSLVSQRLALLKLPEAIQQKVEDGSLSGAAGYQISTLEDEQTQLEIVKQIEVENLNRDDVAALVKDRKAKTAKSRGKTQPPAKDKGGRPQAITKSFKTQKATVSIKFNRKRVSDEDILAAIDEVRDQLLQRTGGAVAARAA